jgi:hypothetical protein
MGNTSTPLFLVLSVLIKIITVHWKGLVRRGILKGNVRHFDPLPPFLSWWDTTKDSFAVKYI